MGRTFDTFRADYDGSILNIDKIITKYKTANMEFNILYDSMNPPRYSPFSGQKIKNASLIFEPISLDELRLITNNLNQTLAAVVMDYYMISQQTIPYQITMRSSAFRVSSIGRMDDSEYFKSPISVRMNINSIRRGENSVSNLSVTIPFNLELPMSR